MTYRCCTAKSILLSFTLLVGLFGIPEVIHSRQELSLANLTPLQEAQLQLEYLELPDGRLFGELRSQLSLENEVSVKFVSGGTSSSGILTAIIEVQPYSDTVSAYSTVSISFANDSKGVRIADVTKASKDLQKLAGRSHVSAESASVACGPGSFCDSPNLFVPKALSTSDPSVWILNRAASQAQTGVELFGRPCGIASYVYIDPLRSYNYVVVTDPNWDRVVAAKDTIAGFAGGGLLAYGQTGSGNGQLRSPRGVCAFGPYIYVADCYNNRVVKYEESNSNLRQVTEYTGLNGPTDVDLHVGNYLVFANAGGNSVEIENILSVTSVGTSPSCLLSAPSLSYPVSVAVGRDPATGVTNNRIYVADAGNNRVVGFSVYLNAHQDYEAGAWQCYDFGASRVELTSIDVDYVGNVYATDAISGTIYKFDRNLLPIAKYGSLGQGAAELFYPEGIEFVQGSRWVTNVGAVELNELGDVLVTERYTDQTGIRRYYIGTDVLNISTTTPAPDVAFAFSYELPSPSIVSIDLFEDSGGSWQLSRSLVSDDVYSHGAQNHRFLTEGDAEGDYKVVVTARSLYGSQQSVDEILYTVSHIATDHPPTITDVYFEKFVPLCLLGDGTLDRLRVLAEDPDGDGISQYEFQLVHPSTWNSAYFPVRLTADMNWDHVITPGAINNVEVALYTTNPPGAFSTAPIKGDDMRRFQSEVESAGENIRFEVRCEANGAWSAWYEIPLTVSADGCDCYNTPPTLERIGFDRFRDYCAKPGEEDTLRIWATDPDGHRINIHLEVSSVGGAMFSFEDGAKLTSDTTVSDTAIAFIAGSYTSTGADIVTVSVDDGLGCSVPESDMIDLVVEPIATDCNLAPSFVSPLGLAGADMSCIVDGTIWLAGGNSIDPEFDALLCHWTSTLGHFEFPEGQTSQDTMVRQSDSLWYRAMCPTDGNGNPIEGTETITLTVSDPFGEEATSLRTFNVYPTANNCPGSNPGCPFLYVWDGSRWVFENSILASSEGRTNQKDTLYDYYLLSSNAIAKNGVIRIRISEQENEISFIDEVALYAIDAPIDRRVSVDNAGHLYALMEPLSPSSILDYRGVEHRDLLRQYDDESFGSEGRGHLVLTYDPPATESRSGADRSDGNYLPQSAAIGPPGGEVPHPGKEGEAYKLAAFTISDPSDTSSAAVTVEVSTRRSEWSLVDKIYPRVNGGTRFLDFSPWVPSSDIPFQVRYSWGKGYSADALGLYRHEKLTESRRARLKNSMSYHSRHGDVTDRLSNTGGERVTLSPGEEVEMVFESRPVDTRFNRRYLLRVKGYYDPIDARISKNALDILPEHYSLSQNYPNPFNPSTRFEFALPLDAFVSLQVFNVLGQRVRTLAQQEYPAGTHSVSWDSADDEGRELGSGLYFYKLTTAAFSATRKMLLLR